MDESRRRKAYRCLSLTIANSFGWELTCPVQFEVEWTGGNATTDITIEPRSAVLEQLVRSHCGQGILTLETGYVFRTDAPYALLVTGPMNRAKDGVSYLAGVVETFWYPFVLSVNLRLTRPGTRIRFVAGEPFGHLAPVVVNLPNDVQPELRSLKTNPELWRQFHSWTLARMVDQHRLPLPTDAKSSSYPYYYHLGVLPDGGVCSPGAHCTRVRPAQFIDASSSASEHSCHDVGTDTYGESGSCDV
jgi:hypothetical protein